jgi:histidine triad (HIT) family protein
MPRANECAFCEYLSGRRPYTVLWREPEVAVLVTREQRGISHLLVLPTAHRISILDVATLEASDLMIALRDAARTIASTEDSDGLSIWQNNGRPANQAIPHLHFHVAGTLPEGGTNFDKVPELTVAQTDEIARRLVANVPRTANRRVFGDVNED